MISQWGALWIALRRANAGMSIFSWWDRALDKDHELREVQVLERETPHANEGTTLGTPDRPCTRCGLADRAQVHHEEGS